MICDDCQNNCYDEQLDEYYCSVDLDEDEVLRFMQNHGAQCSFYKPYDEYKLVAKQN